jgi:outer membrane lipoprotein carrier protein
MLPLAGRWYHSHPVKLSNAVGVRRSTKAVALVAGLALGAALAPAGAAAPDAAEVLARRLDKRHQSLGDLTATFVQTYRSGLMQREIRESGIVSIKRPGRMRWEYQKPEKKLFVADGKSFYFYVPADRQVIVRRSAGERSIPSLLLSGRSGILSEFKVALDEAPAAGLQRLRLTPRRPDPEVETVTLDVDAGDRVRSIEVRDPQGNRSRFLFDQIKENVGLREGLFQFRIPQGVEVVTG